MIWMWNKWNLWNYSPLLRNHDDQDFCWIRPLKEGRSDSREHQTTMIPPKATAWASSRPNNLWYENYIIIKYTHMEWRLTPCATTDQWKDSTAAFEVQPLNLHVGMVWAWGCWPRGQLTCEDSDSLCVNAIRVGLKQAQTWFGAKARLMQGLIMTSRIWGSGIYLAL